MKVTNWDHELIDIDEYPKEIFDKKESILANSVIAINFDLLRKIKPDQKILEIGCGSYSWIKENLNDNKIIWNGLDVKKYSKDELNIATEIGSVHDMSYEDSSFDYILSNQSIEHWSEYNVEIEDGFKEMGRCLKFEGEIFINFPLYLHGEPIFVKGRMDIIKNKIEKYFLIKNIVAYYSTSHDDYKGWSLCGFPDWYVPSNANTSFVVNVILKKKSNFDYSKKNIKKNNLKRRNKYILHLRYGVIYFIWKMFNYIKKISKYEYK